MLRAEGSCLNCLRRYPPVVCASYIHTDSQSRGMRRKYPSRARNNVAIEAEIPTRGFDSMALVRTEIPGAFGAPLSAVNACSNIPVEPTSRNTELFQLCKLSTANDPVENLSN
jgi:hypothetical protein